MTELSGKVAGRRRVVLFLSVCALGVSSIITQLTLMREFLSVFSGNEMIYGIILGSWLLLAGLGAGSATWRCGRRLAWRC